MANPDINPYVFALLYDSDFKRRDDTGTWSHLDGRPFSKEEQALAFRATLAEFEELSAQFTRYRNYTQGLTSKDEQAEFDRPFALADERVRPFTANTF
ncbi:hypothetical protein ACIHCQ_00875 [Streptomyces sp. NPDC052236]|uniref:hypothetical protein n=1 Tax=Streptomyces sp. NPDC052236 TaxID=3365686 RepID=UPI0037D3B380